MKVLLLGSNGQLGWEIHKQATAKSLSILALDRSKLDILSFNEVKKTVSEAKPDIVINATGYTAVDQAEKESDLAFSINRDAARNLAQVCDLNNIPLIHFSTDYVFDGRKGTPYLETDSVNPLNVYGQSKWEGEEEIRKYLDKHFILRISWVFGEHGKNFVKTIVKLAGEKKELKVIADQYGCPTATKDIALNIIESLNDLLGSKNSKWGTYHYCGRPITTWYEFAKKIIDRRKIYSTLACESIMPISTSEYKALAKRPLYSVLDTNLVVNKLKFSESEWVNSIDSVVCV